MTVDNAICSCHGGFADSFVTWFWCQVILFVNKMGIFNFDPSLKHLFSFFFCFTFDK